MSFFSRLFRATRPSAQRRAIAKRSAGLSLEMLEARFTPAIDVTGAGADHVTITDTNTGKVDNSIQIIDDLDSNTTFIKINNGPEQKLGSSGVLLEDLKISMGSGNDKVSFVVRGNANDYHGDMARFIDLGSGNDSLSVDLGLDHDLNGHQVGYSLFGDTTGNDAYTIVGEAVDGAFRFDAASSPETAGKDVYKFNMLAHDAALTLSVADLAGDDTYIGELRALHNPHEAELDVTDVAGNDSYTMTVSGDGASSIVVAIADAAGSDAYKIATRTSSGANVAIVVQDTSAGGSNSLTYTQGNVIGGSEDVQFTFAGKASNKVSITGNVLITDATVEVSYQGGDGVDIVSIDDNLIEGGASYELHVATAGGADKVSAKFDGRNDKTQQGVASASVETITVELGDGNDSFAAMIDGGRFNIDEAGLVGQAALNLIVSGEQGNDSLSLKAAGSKPIEVLGDLSALFVGFSGGAGNDVIDVSVGNIGSTNGDAAIAIFANGDAGADKLSVAGTLSTNSPDLQLVVNVSLGSDADKDSFKSTIHAANGVSFGPLSLFKINQFASGVDSLSLDKNAHSPTYVMV